MNQHSPLDDELTRALRDQASYAPTSLSLDGVQGRARRIRRNRLAVAGAGVAAVALAIAGPALLLDGGADRSAPEIADGTTGPTDVPTTAPTTDATTDAPTDQPTGAAGSPVTPVDPDTAIELGLDAPVGDAPSAVWAAGSVIHLANGDTIDLDEDGPQDIAAVAQLDDSVVVTRHDARDSTVPAQVQVIRTDGSFTAFYEYPNDPDAYFDNSVVGTTDHSLVAYIEGSGDVVVLEDGGSTRTVLGAFEAGIPQVAAVTGTSCADGDCRVLIDDIENGGVYSMAPGGETDELPGAISASDVSPIGYLGLQESGEMTNETITGLLRPDGGDGWMQTAQFVQRFSPGGRYVSALASMYDGPASREVAILDAEDGSRLALFEFSGTESGGATTIAWEDDEHLLAAVVIGPEQALLRLGVDGTVERVSDVVPSDLLGDGSGEDVQLLLGR